MLLAVVPCPKCTKDDKGHPVAYISKSLSPAERNYDIYDKGDVSRHDVRWSSGINYLEGAKHRSRFSWIIKNHRILHDPAQKLNCRQACWVVISVPFWRSISRIVWVNQAPNPDLLSRHSVIKEGGRKWSFMLKPECFHQEQGLAAAFINPLPR